MKKGQSAFELLTTYGWVFLTVLMVAGVLSFLNITNPQIFLSEKCEVDSEFKCIEYGMFTNDSGSAALLLLRNRVEEPIRDISKISCDFGNNVTDEVSFGKDIKPGETVEILCQAPKQDWLLGRKEKINFKIVYYTNITARGIPQVANGHVYAEVK